MKTLSRLTGDAPIIVLDETTAALDALAEYGTHEELLSRVKVSSIH